MKRTTLFITLIVTVIMFGLMWAVLPASAEPPQAPITWSAWQPLNLAQPIGTPDAPTGVCAAGAIPTYTLMFTATKDAYVNQAFPSNNYGTADLYVGQQRRALVQFNLSALPANAVVVSATLELYEIWNKAAALEAMSATTVEVQSILASWDESTVTWSNQPVAESQGDPIYTLVSAPTYDKMDVTKIAQAWKSGVVVNNGILIRNDSLTPYYGFESRNNSNTHKPRLTIVYHTCAKPLTGVSVSGPTLGVTNTGYTFNSTLFPFDATTPITYRWTATNYTCGAKPNPDLSGGHVSHLYLDGIGRPDRDTHGQELQRRDVHGDARHHPHHAFANLPCACDEPDVEWSQHGHHRHKLCVHGDDLQKPHLSSDVHLAGERSLYDDGGFVVIPILPNT